jgi:phage protein D
LDSKSYSFKTLENSYEGFVAPSFNIKIGPKTIDSFKIPISSLSVDIDAGRSAGGCSFTVESLYDYAKSEWTNTLLSNVKVGDKLVIDGGYAPKKKQLFYGFVDDITINYEGGGSPSVSVSGIDAKGCLMNAETRKYMSAKEPSAIVKEILGKCVSAGYAERVNVGTLAKFNAELIQEDMDDYTFLCSLADFYGMRFFVVSGEIVFDDVVAKKSKIMTLTMGVGLSGFAKTVSLRRQVGKVVVYGVDPKTKKAIKGEASSTTISGKGSEAGEVASGFGKITETVNSLFVTTPKECENYAQARLDSHALGFVSGQGSCIGIPEIIPGRYIGVEGLDSNSEDEYFVEKVTHEFSSAKGYHIKFEVKGAKSK